jgi:riboflavin synthase
MFTGIIEHLGVIDGIIKDQNNMHLTIKSDLTTALKVDESIAHNGVCLTVTKILDITTYTVTAIAETLAKTTMGNWQVGQKLNLERAMQIGARLDGHFVQGHVDTTAICTALTTDNGSWLYTFKIDERHAPLVVEKGSVCINGTSLTCYNVTNNSFMVAIIPYTYEHTTIDAVSINSFVNIEFDVIGKYILRSKSLQNNI